LNSRSEADVEICCCAPSIKSADFPCYFDFFPVIANSFPCYSKSGKRVKHLKMLDIVTIRRASTALFFPIFPVFFPVMGQNRAETGSRGTASTATQSVSNRSPPRIWELCRASRCLWLCPAARDSNAGNFHLQSHRSRGRVSGSARAISAISRGSPETGSLTGIISRFFCAIHRPLASQARAISGLFGRRTPKRERDNREFFLGYQGIKK